MRNRTQWTLGVLWDQAPMEGVLIAAKGCLWWWKNEIPIRLGSNIALISCKWKVRQRQGRYVLGLTNALSLPSLVRNISLQTASFLILLSASWDLGVWSCSSWSSTTKTCSCGSSFVSKTVESYRWELVEIIEVRGVRGGWEESGFIWKEELGSKGGW